MEAIIAGGTAAIVVGLVFCFIVWRIDRRHRDNVEALLHPKSEMCQRWPECECLAQGTVIDCGVTL